MGHTDVEELLLFAIANSFYRLASRAAPDRRSAGRRRTDRPGPPPPEIAESLAALGNPVPPRASKIRPEPAGNTPGSAAAGHARTGKKAPGGFRRPSCLRGKRGIVFFVSL